MIITHKGKSVLPINKCSLNLGDIIYDTNADSTQETYMVGIMRETKQRVWIKLSSGEIHGWDWIGTSSNILDSNYIKLDGILTLE